MLGILDRAADTSARLPFKRERDDGLSSAVRYHRQEWFYLE